jgi:restriction system protein
MGELVKGVFAILLDGPDEGLPAAQVLRLLAERVPPTEFERGYYESSPNTRRFEKVARFATINSVKAGWLIKNKGQWSLTPEGRAAFAAFPDAEAFQREAIRLYRAWKRGQPTEPEPELLEDEAAASTFEESEESASAEIREYLGRMPPYDFQNLVAALLQAMGYHVLWVAPPGPDRGIDMIAHTDPLGTSSPRIKVQVKRQPDTKIGREGISSFVGILGAHDVGIYVSAGGFTTEAEREARSQEQRRITLIDLDRLVELWIQHSPRLDDADRQRLPLKPIYFLTPPD